MWIASFYGHQKCVQLLIEGGANANVPNKVTVTKLKTTYLTSVQVLVISVGLLSAWRVVVCGAELLWCPVSVSVKQRELRRVGEVELAKCKASCREDSGCCLSDN